MPSTKVPESDAYERKLEALSQKVVSAFLTRSKAIYLSSHIMHSLNGVSGILYVYDTTDGRLCLQNVSSTQWHDANSQGCLDLWIKLDASEKLRT